MGLEQVRLSAAERDALRQSYGAELKRCRERSGLTQEQLGDQLGYSNGQVSMIETGRRNAGPDFTAKCDKILRTGGSLMRLLPQTQGYPSWFVEFVELEAEATAIQEVEIQLVPGLLQTEDYARALLRNSWPPKSDEEIEQRLAARADRQRILDRDTPPLFSIVINEAALHLPVGGEAVVRGQFRHLLAAAERPYIELQVLTYASAARSPIGGAFTVLDFANGIPVAYTDSLYSSQVVSEPQTVERYRSAFAATCRRALSPEDSADLIRRMLGES